MQLHALPSTHKKSQRIGRSGKRGSYSGRGQKGQRSRSGHRIRPAERDLILKLPKMRGFRNKPREDKPLVFNVGTLSRRLRSHVEGKNPLEVNLALLKVAGLIKKDYRGEVKVLAGGNALFPMAVTGIRVSGEARTKIEKAGGNVK